MLESEQEMDDRKNNLSISGMNNVQDLIEAAVHNTTYKVSIEKTQ